MSEYDVIPYTSVPFVQTHPDRLATMARLFGATPAPPPVETCRVLEIGCARGDNLIPLALSLPDTELVGIDLSRRQIEHAEGVRGAMGAGNVRFEALDLCAIDASYGEFDFIIAHGVYSWVPAAVRDRLLAVCRERLRPNGVAFVSYNVFPGWHGRQPVRDVLLYHTRGIDDPRTRLEQAGAVLGFLEQAIPEGMEDYAAGFKEVHETIRHQPDRIPWLFHDLMAEVNDPVHFHQFVEHAQRHGLQFLAESEIAVMHTHRLPPGVAKTLAGLGDDIVRREQYLDFVNNRRFRQSLLCHEAVRLDRTLATERLSGLNVAADLQPVGEITDDKLESTAPLEFRSPDGVELAANDPLTKAAFLALGKTWPDSIPFDDLGAVARRELTAPGRAEPDRRELDQAVLQSHTAGMVELRLTRPRFARRAGERPEASPWVRLQAAAGPRVTNLRHSRVRMSDLNRHLLCVLDGTRDRDAIVEALAERVEQAGTTVKRGDEEVGGGVELRRFLRETLEQDLAAAARSALLIA